MNNGPMLDIRRLLVFSTVVDTGSVTAAAHRLGFTPSSVSQQVSLLEREVGLALLEKSGRGIKPTSAGLTLAEQARVVMRAVTDAEEVMADLREGRTGRVRVVSFNSAGDSLMPSAVADLRQTQPGLQVATSIADTEEAYDQLRASRVEVALVLEPYGPGDEPDDGLVHIHLLDDPYRVMLPEGHRLAGESVVDLTDLSGDDWVSAIGGNGLCRDETVDICRRAGFSPHFVAQAVEFPAAQAYVATGIGVGLFPVLALGLIHDGVVVRPIRKEPEPRHVWAITRPALVEHVPVAQTLKALRKAAAEHRKANSRSRVSA
jgi:DNA-binding transcriptional LysR family regulator